MHNLIVFLAACSAAQALNMNHVAGQYKFYASDTRTPNYLEITQDGRARFRQKDLNCTGTAKLSDSELSSFFVCTDNQNFTLKVKFENVDLQAPAFVASVFNSAKNHEEMMTIERLK